jgi:hypothetical protein
VSLYRDYANANGDPPNADSDADRVRDDDHHSDYHAPDYSYRLAKFYSDRNHNADPNCHADAHRHAHRLWPDVIPGRVLV